MDDYVGVTTCFFWGGGVTTLSGMVSRNFLGNDFFLVGPPPAGNSNLVVFGPILGLWHLGKFRARAENRKTQFPGASGTSMGKNVTTLSGMVFRNLLGKDFFLVGPPPAGNGKLVGVWPILGLWH